MNTAVAPQALAASARARAQQLTVTLDSTLTSYWYYPARNSKSLGSIVFIHGYRGNHHGLEAIAGAISNFDVYIPDLPGFGASEPFSQKHTIDRYARWVRDFLESLKLNAKPHLLGHSFGSIVVSAYASQYQGISSLILENPVAAPALTGPKAATTKLAKAFFWLAGALPDALGTGLLKSWPMVRGMSIIMTKTRQRDLRSWVHQQHDENFNDFANRRVALEAYQASISNCVGDLAAKFTAPTLMMIGELDDITTVAQQQVLFENLPVKQKRLKQHGAVGHLTHYEVPAAIANDIEQWASEVGESRK